MIRLGRDELAGMPHLSVDERLARVEAVDLSQVQTVARDLYGSTVKMIGAVGPFAGPELEPYLETV
jgi:hypothetical protein